MSCKSALYAANTVYQSVLANASVNFGNAIRRYGQNCNISGGEVVISGQGYYFADVNVTFATDADTSGLVTVQVYCDGSPVPGALATLTTAVNSTYHVSVPFMIRNACCCDKPVTVQISSDVSVSNAAITVLKV